jgi:hypothetical protein
VKVPLVGDVVVRVVVVGAEIYHRDVSRWVLLEVPDLRLVTLDL